jgi:hypothetical protein
MGKRPVLNGPFLFLLSPKKSLYLLINSHLYLLLLFYFKKNPEDWKDSALMEEVISANHHLISSA